MDAAGRHQSYSKAGEELGLTHSAVSHRIRELEEILGKKLFERQGNHMVPTSDGKRLLAQVRNAMGLLESIFSSSPEPSKQRLTISLSPALSRWLVPRLGTFRAEHQGLDLQLHLSSMPVELGNGIDAGVRYGLGSWPDTMSSLLSAEILFPVASPTYLAGYPTRQPSDLLDYNLLRHPWHSWAAWFEAAGVSAGEPRDGPEYSDSSLLVDAALAGEGIALARGLGVIDRLKDRSLVRLFDISIPDERSYYFVRPSSKRDPMLAEVENWLAGEFRQVQAELSQRNASPLAPPVPPS